MEDDQALPKKEEKLNATKCFYHTSILRECFIPMIICCVSPLVVFAQNVVEKKDTLTPINHHLPQQKVSKVPLLIKDFKRPLSPLELRLPLQIKRLLTAYPLQLKTATVTGQDQGQLVLTTGERLHWEVVDHQYTIDEWSELSLSQRRSLLSVSHEDEYESRLNQASLRDQLLQAYPRYGEFSQKKVLVPPPFFEPGRLRDERFFKAIYGSSRVQVKNSLSAVKWGKQRLLATTINRIDERLRAIYQELKRLPKRFRSYIQPSAGAFTWRKIKGTPRLSVHSFGAAIDIAVKRSNYWRWTLKVFGQTSDGLIPYKNQFPLEIIEVFERYGFIWGGRWYHHDTMHFEYRPELLVTLKEEDDLNLRNRPQQ